MVEPLKLQILCNILDPTHTVLKFLQKVLAGNVLCVPYRSLYFASISAVETAATKGDANNLIFMRFPGKTAVIIFRYPSQVLG